MSSVHCHVAHSKHRKPLRNLLLSISFDWRIKLWDMKSTSSADNKQGSLLLEIVNPSYDYLCDVKWSPIHPALFACATADNSILIWNLLKSTSEPLDVIKLSADQSVIDNCLWDKSGKALLVGKSNGTVVQIELDETITTPKPNDEIEMERFVEKVLQKEI